MADSGFFPPDYVRSPQLIMGVELELDFALPRNAYADWLATDPEIPHTDDDNSPSARKERRKAGIRQVHDRIASLQESAMNGPQQMANY